MMVDLTDKIGFPVFFDTETLEITYGDDIVPVGSLGNLPKDWSKDMKANAMSGDALWKSLKIAQESKEDIDPSKYWPEGKPLYFGRQAVWDNKGVNLQELIEKQNLRPDITVLPAGTLGDEFLRTEGHHHLSLLPEVYETNFGTNGYLLFKRASEDPENPDIDDVMFVVAEAGDHVLFPPKYQHISINIGDKPFVMTDWVSSRANSDFRFIKDHQGAPYWVTKGPSGEFQFERNPSYKGKVPEVRVLKPTNKILHPNGSVLFEKGRPMFDIARKGDVRLLDFLNDTAEMPEFYEKAFVPYE